MLYVLGIRLLGVCRSMNLWLFAIYMCSVILLLT